MLLISTICQFKIAKGEYDSYRGSTHENIGSYLKSTNTQNQVDFFAIVFSFAYCVLRAFMPSPSYLEHVHTEEHFQSILLLIQTAMPILHTIMLFGMYG